MNTRVGPLFPVPDHQRLCDKIVKGLSALGEDRGEITRPEKRQALGDGPEGGRGRK